MKIYLDICCFNRPFDDQNQLRVRLETEAKLSVQEAIRSGNVNLVWSYVMDTENTANPYDERRESIAPWQDLACEDIEETSEILERAEELAGQGFKPKDALHICCAIQGKCPFFLTTDDGILKRAQLVTELAVMNPLEYATLNDD